MTTARPDATRRQRLRYRFDRAISHGSGVVILWLGGLTLTVIVIAALFLAITGLGASNAEASFVEAFWQSLLRVLDTGTLAGDAGWGLRIVSLLLTLSGVIIASSLIGLVATGFDQKIGELRKGRSAVMEHGHTLVLGWSPRLFKLLSELAVANQNQRSSAVVVLAPEDKTQMEDAIRDRVRNQGTMRIVCRTGNPAEPENLELVNVRGAKAIVVLSPSDGYGDAAAIKAVLAVLSIDPALTVAHVVVEMTDARNARTLVHATHEKVLAVRADEVIARVTAQACHQAGLSVVWRELLDFDGDEIYLQAAPELAGHTFGEALLAYETSTIIGRAGPDGIELNPPMDSLFHPGDSVVAITADDDTIIFSGLRDPAPAPPVLPATAPRPHQRILLVGWSDLGPEVLRELDQFLPSGTTIDIVVDDALVVPPTPEDLELKQATVRFYPTPDEAEQIGAVAATIRYDQAIVLGYRDKITAVEADARTLLTLLTLRAAWSNAGVTPPRVVAEVLDARDIGLAQASGADEFVASDELSSLLMAQLAERPELAKIFDELFDVEGTSIALQPVTDYVEPGTLAAATLVAAGRARDEVVLGIRSGGRVRLNLPKSTELTVGVGDQLVVLGARR